MSLKLYFHYKNRGFMNIIFKSKIKLFSNSHRAILLCGLFVLFFIFSFGMVRSAEVGADEVNVQENDQRIKQIKEEIKQTQEEINKYTEEVKAQQQKARTLQRDIAIYNSKMNKNELELKETKLSIQAADAEIDEIKEKLTEGEIKIEENKESLKNLIRLLYSYEQDSMLEILITRDNLSDFFNEIDAVESVKNGMFQAVISLRIQEEELKLKREELEEQQEEKGGLIQLKMYQNESLAGLKSEKNELLDTTKGEETKFQQLLEENESVLPSLRAQLSEFQSLGQKIEFDDAYSASEYASSVTGVRQEFILAIFQRETRLGTFKGTGNWEDDMYKCYLRLSKYFPEHEAWYINRANTEKNAFFEVVEQLNLDPNSVKLSAEPKSLGCGGAMGFAQFIPSTWLSYKERVSAVTGHYPPSPWNLADSLVAMAVKLSDVKGVTEGNYNAEREAAGRYHGGGKWYKKQSSINYANDVMNWADWYVENLSSLQ